MSICTRWIRITIGSLALLLAGPAGSATAQPPLPPPLAPGPRVVNPFVPSEVFASALQRRLARATVRVLAGKGHGTGTVVGRQGDQALILTAWHVLKDHPRPSVEIFCSDNAPGGIYEGAELLGHDAGADLALLHLRSSQLTNVIPVCPAGSDPAPRFACLTAGCNTGVPSFQAATVINRVPAPALVGWCWETDRNPEPGRAGGALIDERGYLVGVCTCGRDGRGYYADAAAVRALLSACGQRALEAGPAAVSLDEGDVCQIVLRLLLAWLVAARLQRWLGPLSVGKRNGLPLLVLLLPFVASLLHQSLLVRLTWQQSLVCIAVLSGLQFAVFAWACSTCAMRWSEPFCILPALGPVFTLTFLPPPVVTAAVALGYYVPLAAMSWTGAAADARSAPAPSECSAENHAPVAPVAPLPPDTVL